MNRCNACGTVHGLGAFERDAQGNIIVAGFRLDELSGFATVILGLVALYNIIQPTRRRR